MGLKQPDARTLAFEAHEQLSRRPVDVEQLQASHDRLEKAVSNLISTTSMNSMEHWAVIDAKEALMWVYRRGANRG